MANRLVKQNQYSDVLQASDEKLREVLFRFSDVLNLKKTHLFPVLKIRQEVLFVDRDLFTKRPDLVLTGRSLFQSEKGDLRSSSPSIRARSCVEACQKRAGNALQSAGFLEGDFQGFFELKEQTPELCLNQHIDLIQIIKESSSKLGLESLFHQKPFAEIRDTEREFHWSLQVESGSDIWKMAFYLILASILRLLRHHRTLLIAFMGKEDRPFVSLEPSIEKKLQVLKLFSTEKKTSGNAQFTITEKGLVFHSRGTFFDPMLMIAIFQTLFAKSLQVTLDEIETKIDRESSLEIKEGIIFPIVQKIFHTATDLFTLKQEARHSFFQAFIHPRSVDGLEGVLNESQLKTLHETFLQSYVEQMQREARCLIDLFHTHVLPASLEAGEKQRESLQMTSARLSGKWTVLSMAIQDAVSSIDELSRVLKQLQELGWEAKAKVLSELIEPKMGVAISMIGSIEKMVEEPLWPLPKYLQLLYS